MVDQSFAGDTGLNDAKSPAAAVTRFAASLRARGKQPSTVESYCRDAQQFLDFLGRAGIATTDVEPETLLAYQAVLRDEQAERENSVRRSVIGIRQFFRFLTSDRVLSSTPFDAVPIPERQDQLPRPLAGSQMVALFAAAATGRPAVRAARDEALLALLAYEGLKSSELIGLEWSDLLGDEERPSLRIATGRPRVITLSSETARPLARYRLAYNQLRRPSLAMAKSRPRMFLSFKGRDAAAVLPQMTRHGLKFILYELGDKVGSKGLNAELLRHFAVAHLIDLGLGPEAIMAHLGLRRLGNIAKHLASHKRAVHRRDADPTPPPTPTPTPPPNTAGTL